MTERRKQLTDKEILGNSEKLSELVTSSSDSGK